MTNKKFLEHVGDVLLLFCKEKEANGFELKTGKYSLTFLALDRNSQEEEDE